MIDLKLIKYIEKDIKRIDRDIARLYNVQALIYSDKVKSASVSDTSDIIVKLEELQEERKKAIKRYVDLRLKTYKTIQSINDKTQQELLKLRYYDYKNWDEIASNLGYSLRYVHKLHNRALQEYEKLANSAIFEVNFYKKSSIGR